MIAKRWEDRLAAETARGVQRGKGGPKNRKPLPAIYPPQAITPTGASPRPPCRTLPRPPGPWLAPPRPSP